MADIISMKNQLMPAAGNGTDRLTKREVAAMLRLSPKTIERRMRSRQIGYEKDGRLVYFSAANVADYRSSRRIRACGVAAR
jgi:excisionase family DNA binding protein